MGHVEITDLTVHEHHLFVFFFGSGNKLNWYEILPANLPQTNQIAELCKALKAVSRAQELIGSKGGPACRTVVLLDSSYVVKGITTYILKSRLNGFRNAKG